MLNIQKFIRQHKDWEVKLTESPFFLKIKKKNNLIMFNYDLYQSEPCEIVNEARGLILDANQNFEVVRYGFYRFYNCHEPGATEIDWDSPLSITEKIDGSLIMFYYYEGVWHTSTRNTFDAEDATIQGRSITFQTLVNEALREQNISFSDFTKGHTYVFELVSPSAQVVIPYKKTLLYFLLDRNNTTFEETVAPPIENWMMPKVFNFTSLSAAEEYVSSFNGRDFEGIVVCDARGNRIKVKNLNWLAAHHLCSNNHFTAEDALDAYLTGESAEIVSYFPERRELIDRVSSVYHFFKIFTKMLDESEIAKNWDHDKGRFAKEVNSSFHETPAFRALLFSAWDKKAARWFETLSSKKFIKMFYNQYE